MVHRSWYNDGFVEHAFTVIKHAYIASFTIAPARLIVERYRYSVD